jgi:hypothetical protein
MCEQRSGGKKEDASWEWAPKWALDVVSEDMDSNHHLPLLVTACVTCLGSDSWSLKPGWYSRYMKGLFQAEPFRDLWLAFFSWAKHEVCAHLVRTLHTQCTARKALELGLGLLFNLNFFLYVGPVGSVESTTMRHSLGGTHWMAWTHLRMRGCCT